ncbi:MAG: transcriptional repressor [Candidatus Nanopelagicales bacterium]
MTTAPQRQTRQRSAVASALQGIDDFRSSQQLHEYLREHGESVGLTTVYRTLRAMADAGEVDVIVREDGESVYRQCSNSHHHHLVCRNCGATVEIEGPTVERWADAMAAEHGFTQVSHTMELFGLCAHCGT